MAREITVSLFKGSDVDSFNGNNEWLKYHYSIPVTLKSIKVWCKKIPQNNNPNAQYIVQLQARSGSTSINSKEIDISGGDNYYDFTFEPQLEIAENTDCIIQPSKRVNANIPSINGNSSLGESKDPSNYILQGIGSFPTDNPYTGNSWAWKCDITFSVSNFIWRGGGYPQLLANPDVGDHVWPGTGEGGDPYNEGVWRIKEGANDGYPHIIKIEVAPKPQDSLYKKIPSTSTPEDPSKSEYIPYSFYVKTENGLIPILISQKKQQT